MLTTTKKKADSFQLIELMQEWSDSEPKMWGPSIIGFGNYHYKYASGHEGDAPVLGFSPRKQALTLYVYSDTEKSKLALADLGKYKITKGCIYVGSVQKVRNEVDFRRGQRRRILILRIDRNEKDTSFLAITSKTQRS